MAQAIESASKTKPRFCFATMKNSMDGVFQSILRHSWKRIGGFPVEKMPK